MRPRPLTILVSLVVHAALLLALTLAHAARSADLDPPRLGAERVPGGAPVVPAVTIIRLTPKPIAEPPRARRQPAPRPPRQPTSKPAAQKLPVEHAHWPDSPPPPRPFTAGTAASAAPTAGAAVEPSETAVQTTTNPTTPTEVPDVQLPVEPVLGAMPAPAGATTQAEVLGRLRVIYPRRSVRRGEEGSVLLSVTVAANGSATDVRIVQSSGHSRLDAAAVAALRRAVFEPARRDGVPVSATVRVPVTFRLRD